MKKFSFEVSWNNGKITSKELMASNASFAWIEFMDQHLKQLMRRENAAPAEIGMDEIKE